MPASQREYFLSRVYFSYDKADSTGIDLLCLRCAIVHHYIYVNVTHWYSIRLINNAERYWIPIKPLSRPDYLESFSGVEPIYESDCTE